MRTKAERRLSLNSRRARLSIAAILVTIPIAAGSPANAADFSFTTINVPGALYTSAYGINNAGQIVGSFYDGTSDHGFLDIGGSFTTIDAPGAINDTRAYGINNAGQIVGSFYDSTGIHGFLDTGGSFT